MMAADTMEALGIPRGQYVVKVNNRKVLDGVMEAIGLGGESNAIRRLNVLRAIDKLDRVGIEGVRLLLGEGRKDESGDFTKGAGLDQTQIEKIIVFAQLQSGKITELEDVTNLSQSDRNTKGEVLTFKPSDSDDEPSHFVESNKGVIDGLLTHFGSQPTSREGIKELQQIAELVETSGYQRQQIRIDPSVVRGLEYYTGPVYEVELLIETKDDKGRPVRFGSVGGGGRYDGLVSRFRGQPVPATGFSFGVSRLQAALTMIGKLDTKPAPGPVLVTVFRDGSTADYQKLVAALRNAGIRAELYLGSTNHNLGQQLKYADRRDSPCAVIQGGDEKAKGQVLIRDLIAGAELAKLEQSGREGYLQKQAEAQRSVPEADLVEEVRAVLARHGVRWS
jgi:histidyl-tRNA synthetase